MESVCEMVAATTDKERLKIILNNLVQDNRQWFDQQNITVGNKGNYWILDYRPGPKNDFNRLLRGMVVQKPNGPVADPTTLIRSFPMTRFFNQQEPEVAPVNLGNAEMLEKLDGTMVGVFFPTGDPTNPQWHTRKMMSTHEPDTKKSLRAFQTQERFQLIPLIGQYVKRLKFDANDTHYTYVFEFIHANSAVITKYHQGQYGMYLLAARNLQTHEEEPENSLDQIAAKIGAGRPQRWDSVADEDQIRSMMQKVASEIEDFEGYVFRDRETGNRMKVKDPDYVKKHHMLSDLLSAKKLLPKVLAGEEDEIIAYFPHAKAIVDKLRKLHSDYVRGVADAVLDYQTRTFKNRAELFHTAKAELKDSFAVNAVMKCYEMGEEETYRHINQQLTNVGLTERRFYMELIGLDDDGEDDLEP